MIVYNNSEPEWRDRRYRLNRVNGAETYGAEIEKFQIPIWRELSDDITVSTTNLLSNMENPILSGTNVQYLHTYPIDDPQKQFRAVLGITTDPIFVTSYMGLHAAIQQAGYRSIFIPMTIDDTNIPKQVENPKNAFIWYGNITSDKWHTFGKLLRYFDSIGVQFDWISNNRFRDKGPKLSQQECWDIISQYKYGVGVGRCYMEMAAMGLKCIIAGNDIGGIVTSEYEHRRQVDTNYNARYHTFSKDLRTLLENIDDAIPMYESIHDNLDLIRERIQNIYGAKT